MIEKSALVSVFHPGSIRFIDDYIHAIQNQSNRSFELLAFADGLEELEDKLINSGVVNYRIIPVKGNPSKIRIDLIDYCTRSDFDYFIFQDSDDFPSMNRVEDSIKLLNKYPIVFTDLCLIDETGGIIHDNYWSKRIKNADLFYKTNLETSNFLGLGNTAIQKEVLSMKIQGEPVIPDWYIFYKTIDNFEAIFSNKSKVFYRQYSDNFISSNYNEESLNNIVNNKFLHYQSLIDEHEELFPHYLKLKSLKAKMKDSSFVELALLKLKGINVNLFWWEETEFIQ